MLRKNKKVVVPCSRCHGTGHEDLTGSLMEMFGTIRNKPGRSSEQYAAILGLNLSAASNRIGRLVSMGLVARQRDGRNVVYGVDV